MEEVNYDSIIQLNRLENKTEEILIKLQNHWNRMDAISREIGILSRYEENQISQFFIVVPSGCRSRAIKELKPIRDRARCIILKRCSNSRLRVWWKIDMNLVSSL